ncbi:DVU_1553 family AMP-dependent CoA ligase [Clostridium sp. C2-6-12]|uniref:DVU_1553 family AMP-dependent CoA ligase n=1 Tax=Clostridium sp. C2-6-12 TaxID=2698832 RepID=UPI0013701EAD|nr:AMP-binding protein [Clostridium sp. C2-6-12]
MTKTMYEKWMEDKIIKETGEEILSSDVLKLYQLNKIKKMINIAKKSKFYSKALENINSEDINNFEDFKKIPFTTSEDLRNNSKSFLCTSLNQISRIVTINTSGTTGESKRIFFTENDLKGTIEFFRYGMLNLVEPGQKVLILMPGTSPSSIGLLLKEGLEEAGCEGIVYGPVFDVWDALETLKLKNIDCIVGLPTQVFYLAKLKNTDERYAHLKLKSVLLSADYVPRSICSAVSKAFQCYVFTHYGMSEMGYGGGVECSALNGYHMRDVDLYVEIIDPLAGEEVPEGTYGEVVFTSFNREGMPLIRYRTGDRARFLPNNCSCNQVFKRLDYVTGRLHENFSFRDGSYISIGMLDELMFKIENVLDYKVTIEDGQRIMLNLSIKPIDKSIPLNFIEIENLIKEDKQLSELIENNNILLELGIIVDDIEVSNGMKKRKFDFKKPYK